MLAQLVTFRDTAKRPTSHRAYIRYDHTIYCFQFLRVRLKSEREGVEYSSTPRRSLFDRGCAYDLLCSQNNRLYGRNRIDALLEVGLNKLMSCDVRELLIIF